MSASDDVSSLYTRRAGSYNGCVQAFRHRQALCSVLAASGLLRPGQRILDAGCGTGLSILALAGALKHRGLRAQAIDGFDLTPVMLERCAAAVRAADVPGVTLRQADVLGPGDQLPASWTGYDLITCVSMLEYVPRRRLPAALAALRQRLAPGGRLLAVITRSSFYPTRWIWRCEGYRASELRSACAAAGFTDLAFRYYPWNYAWLNIGNHIIDSAGSTPARGPARPES